MGNLETKKRLEGWHFISPEAPGFHEVVVPGKADCKAIHIYRLNMNSGDEYTLKSDNLEMNAVLLHGAAALSGHSTLLQTMKRFDSFYIPADNQVTITALEGCVFYIAGAKYEGIGDVSYRVYDPALPIGDLHQIHGSGVGRREVMFTLPPQTPASALICGLTWGGMGAWTSWPPHQHENDLEEAYCYFDMPPPKFGFHISYLKSGEVRDAVVHTVQTGHVVLAPCGYHPTVASPTVQNTYFWALAAFTPQSRRYDLAILDPVYEND